MEHGSSKYYAVRVGKIPGIYRSWEEVDELVTGFPGAQHKSFWTYEEAVAYMDGARRSRRGGVAGAHYAGGGSMTDSVASEMRRCRLSAWVGGAPGSSSSSPSSKKEAHIGGCG
ncbi:hypothetical protein PIB30_093460, partial [Stylosanthes scabra]|nr:hypothetical protein [Stylosanthes scabra]